MYSALAWWIFALASCVLLCDLCMSVSICSSCIATDPRKGWLICCESGKTGLEALDVVIAGVVVVST